MLLFWSCWSCKLQRVHIPISWGFATLNLSPSGQSIGNKETIKTVTLKNNTNKKSHFFILLDNKIDFCVWLELKYAVRPIPSLLLVIFSKNNFTVFVHTTTKHKAVTKDKINIIIIINIYSTRPPMARVWEQRKRVTTLI